MKKLTKSNLPDFLIVGAMKAGTSTLSYHLSHHPQIYMPDSELHFFDKDKNFNKGIDWYKEQFKKGGTEQVLGEKTPTYSYLPKIPKRISSTLSEVKLIWIFRDPVDRTYSNYWHAVNAGIEQLSFKDAIEQEEDRLEKSMWYGYKKRSRYTEQVNRYLEYFSKEDMCFLFFKKLVEEKKDELTRVYKFLNVDQYSFESAQKNKTYIPNSIPLQYLFRKIFGRGRIFSLLNRLNHSLKFEYPQMDSEVRTQLEDYFKPYNKKLFKLIGREIEQWS